MDVLMPHGDHRGMIRARSPARIKAMSCADTMRVADRARTGYIGRETDAEHNLGAFGARLYSSEYGRFLAVDKLWEKYRSLQGYQYCRNNPVHFTDRTGMEPGDVFWTMNEAAQDWVETYGAQFMESGYEYASAIGKGVDPAGKEFFVYNEPKSLNSRTGSTPELLEASESTKQFSLTEVAWIHNHPPDLPGDDIVTKPNALSKQDVSAAENKKIDVFAFVPDGRLLCYSHEANKVTVVMEVTTTQQSAETQVVNHGGVPDMTVPRRTSGTE
jgi:RHS repeat-associated protein